MKLATKYNASNLCHVLNATFRSYACIVLCIVRHFWNGPSYLPDVVIIAMVVLLHNQLSIVENKSTEQGSAEVEMKLKESKRAKEDVEDRRQQQHGQTASKET